jgi:hypothetical protein
MGPVGVYFAPLLFYLTYVVPVCSTVLLHLSLRVFQLVASFFTRFLDFLKVTLFQTKESATPHNFESYTLVFCKIS